MRTDVNVPWTSEINQDWSNKQNKQNRKIKTLLTLQKYNETKSKYKTINIKVISWFQINLVF